MKSPPAIERMEPAVDSAPSPGDSLQMEVLCPLCSYDLRGQAEPRCSECGYRFEWSEILDPAKRIHPFLFEHHPEKNIRSFFRTLLAGWRPKKFWSGLLPTQQPSRLRLFVYAMGVSCFILMIGVSVLLRQGLDTWRQAITTRQNMLQQHIFYSFRTDAPDWFKQRMKQFGSPQAVVDSFVPQPTLLSVAKDVYSSLKRYPGSNWVFGEIALVCTITFSWPLLAAMSLNVFRWSMKRASIQTVHVFRCTVYCWDIVAWWAVVVSTFAAFYPLWQLMRWPMVGAFWYGAGIAFVLATYRLARAYQFYLRFDRPWATVIASQVIVLLVYAIAVALFVAITFTPLSIL
ncbi:MAG: hypothetical protein AABZ47_05475 [Planctomycetota bacterium]